MNENVRLIKIMEAIDFEFDDHNMEVCHRIGKSEGNSKKTIVRFCNSKNSKRALYVKKKLASVNIASVGLRNNTKLVISENRTDYNSKLVFKRRTFTVASLVHSTFTKDRAVHIMKCNRGKSGKLLT